MPRLLAVPRTVLALLVGVVATLVCGSLAAVVARLRPLSPLIERIIEAWARSWLVASGVRLQVTGGEHLDPSRSYVVVANHLSNLDIMVCVAAIPLPVRYVAKKELFRIPVLGNAMRAVGMVAVDRAGRGTVLESVTRQAAAVVERGHSVVIYPEGTRSRDGRVHPFKKGAFAIAVASGLPIVPVTLQGTWEAWQPGGWLIRGGEVRVAIDPPLLTEGRDRSEVEALREAAQAIVEKRYEELRTAAQS